MSQTMSKKHFLDTPLMICIILFSTLQVAIFQATPGLFSMSRNLKILSCFSLFLVMWLITLLLHKHGLLENSVFLFVLIGFSMFLRCQYVLLSGLYMRQHDEGCYTGALSSQVNPGHIGYIEYIYKFRHLPDFNPYQLFSYYHPPLHYVISAIFLIFQTFIGVPEELAFENLQIIPLIFSGLAIWHVYLILKELTSDARSQIFGIILFAFHPSLVIMSGSVNNDMLSNFMLCCVILYTIRWIKSRSMSTLMLTGLFIGLGMITKINTALIAFPIGLLMLYYLFWESEHKLKTFLQYIVFGILTGSIGLSFIIRNAILFHEKPGISSSTPDSAMYTGAYSLISRIGIPALRDWHFEFPFHPLSGDAIHNMWVIMFQTSLFTEAYPTTLTGLPLFLCQISYIISILAAVLSFITATIVISKRLFLNSERKTQEISFFLLCSYYIMIIFFTIFAIKYPYTCSSDFRYIVICLVFAGIGIAFGSEDQRTSAKPLRILVGATILSTILTLLLMVGVYATWNQW